LYQPSLKVISLAIHKQPRTTARYDLAILYRCYGRLTLDS
jgi:hypothetical protein